MTAFWIAAGLLTMATLALVAAPLLRRGSTTTASRPIYDRRVYRDQLDEVEREVADGLLTPTEANAARLEIQRRLLATADANDTKATTAPPVRSTKPLLALTLMLVLGVGAFGLYSELGLPDLPDEPLASRIQPDVAAAPSSADDDRAVIARGIDKLAQRLEEQPDDLQGWRMLARGYAILNRPAEAIQALRRARALAPDDPDLREDLGELLVIAAGGRVTDEARADFAQVNASTPNRPRTVYYLALAKAQAGNWQGAREDWATLAAQAPADAPWLPLVQRQIAVADRTLGETVAAPPLSRDAVAAAEAMTPEERAAQIRTMVDRLASRLEQEPDDLDGWRRLARAYRVLGEDKKAAAAEARIKALEQGGTTP